MELLLLNQKLKGNLYLIHKVCILISITVVPFTPIYILYITNSTKFIVYNVYCIFYVYNVYCIFYVCNQINITIVPKCMYNVHDTCIMYQNVLFSRIYQVYSLMNIEHRFCTIIINNFIMYIR